MNHPPVQVLFVCTGNAGRSQMAQAMFRQAVGDHAKVESAGVKPWDHLHSMAVRLMAERGIALTGHAPKPVSAVADRTFDLIVTMGDPARNLLPSSLAGRSRWIHWDIPDPADADGTPDSERAFRSTAEEIARRIPRLLDQISLLKGRPLAAGQPGIGTGLWSPGPFLPAKHLPLAVEAGFRAIELCVYFGPNHFDRQNTGAVRELQQVADDLGINIWSIHSADVGSLAATDPQQRRRALDELRACLDLAETLGAKAVVSHGLLIGPPEGDPARDDAILTARRFTDGLRELVPAVESSPVAIAFENGYVKTHYRARDVLRHVQEHSRAAFGFVLDTGHANLAGDLSEIANYIGDRLISLHLNDNDGKNDWHWSPGDGSIDWKCVAQMLADIRYTGCVLHELMSNGREPRDLLRTAMERHRKFFGNEKRKPCEPRIHH